MLFNRLRLLVRRGTRARDGYPDCGAPFSGFLDKLAADNRADYKHVAAAEVGCGVGLNAERGRACV